MFSAMVYGFPLDKGKKKLDEVAKAVRKGILITMKSLGSLSVFFPQDLRGYDPANGIIIQIINLDSNRTFVWQECAMIRQGIRATLGELLPDIKINVCFP